MTLDEALAAVRSGPCDLAEMMRQQEAAHVLKEEVIRLQVNAAWLKDVADKRGAECDARMAEVARLRADLAANAQMLARQTDLAREAERNAHHAEQAMSSHLPSLDRSALLTQIEALKADLALNAKILAKQTDLVAVLERALARSQSAEADVAGLLLRAERAEAEVARLKALLPVPPADPRTCDHRWYVFDGSAHCYGCNEMRHNVPPDWTGV